MASPTRDEFLRSTPADRRAAVWVDLPADVETPLSAYWKLCQGETHSYMLESVTGGEQLARYSIIGVRPARVVRIKGGRIRTSDEQGTVESELGEGQTPLHILRELVPPDALRAEGMPRFIGGAVGMLAYDIVRWIERLPDAPPDDLGVDDMAMMVDGPVVVFDHARARIRIVRLAAGAAEAYDSAVTEIEALRERLRGPLPPLPDEVAPNGPATSRTAPEAYHEAVRRAIEYIEAGDCIQVVLSQRFETPCRVHPVSVYRALRSLNPSPYMFLLRFGDFDVVGASPEILVSLEDGQARVRPIAGTRPRGADEAADRRLEAELLRDEKELAEHVMLVDLGRNDLGRVSEIGSVQVRELMTVERYSHVMHIVSDVVGRLREGLDAIDLIEATFPAGTVSGAPKVRAMQIIDELEPTRRGLYAGAVGYLGATGDMDLAIAIRTILLKGEHAYVQAGAGIVYDSVPEREAAECASKAQAALRAIEIAHRGL